MRQVLWRILCVVVLSGERHGVPSPLDNGDARRDDGDSDWGGWLRDDLTAEFDSDECSIPIRSEMSPEEFIKDFVEPQRPVLLRLNASRSWPANERWLRSEFLSRYGSIRLTPLSPEGDGEEGEEEGEAEEEVDLPKGSSSTVRSIVDGMESRAASPFAWEDFDAHELHKAIQGDYTIPPLYASVMSQRCTAAEARSFLFFSRPGRGQGWHSHLEAFNVLVFGRKRWFLYANESVGNVVLRGDANYRENWTRLTRHEFHSMEHFYTRLYPALRGTRDAPLECVQTRGDVLYVPTRYLHATISIGASLAMAFVRDKGWGLPLDLPESNSRQSCSFGMEQELLASHDDDNTDLEIAE